MIPSASSCTAAMNRTAPRISDWMWPELSPWKTQSIRNGLQAHQRQHGDHRRQGGEDAQRLVAGVDAADRQAVAAHVAPGRVEQPRLPGLGVGADLDLVDGDQHLPGLDQALERVGEVVDDQQLKRRLAVVGAEARRSHRRSPCRRGAAPPSCRASAGPSWHPRSGRSGSPGDRRPPCRRRPARIGASSFGMSSPRYWLSASVLTIRSAPSLRLASRPAWKAAARPLLLVRRTMCSTPWSRATSTVRSEEPSSITSSSTESTPGISLGRSAIVSGRVASSLRQGIWMISFTGRSSVAAPVPAKRSAACRRRVDWLTDQSIKVHSRTSGRNRDRRSSDRPPTRGQAPPAGARAGRGRQGQGQPEPDGRRGDRRRRRRGDRRGPSRRARRPARRAGGDRRLPQPRRRSGRGDHVRDPRALRPSGSPAALHRGDPRGGDLAGRDRLGGPLREGRRPRPGDPPRRRGRGRARARRRGGRGEAAQPGLSESTPAAGAPWSSSRWRSPSTAGSRPHRASRCGSPGRRAASWSTAGAPRPTRSRSGSAPRSPTTRC